jgi:hypothetical protein
MSPWDELVDGRDELVNSSLDKKLFEELRNHVTTDSAPLRE